MLSNDILRSLRYTLKVNNNDMVRILALSAMESTAASFDTWTTKEDEEGFVRCPDIILSGFLNGLIYDKRGDTTSFDEYWKKDSTAELYHFIGKDIVYFHSLFWPAMLEGSNFRKPTNLFVHGYVTVNGAKMSKSRGTFIKASTWLNHFDADSLRYYYTAKLSSRIDDIDLNLEDFGSISSVGL